MTAFLTLLACVGDGAIVGAVIGGALGYRQRQRRTKRAQERELVRQRYTALLDQGVNASLSPPEQREIMQLSQRWRDVGLPQTPLGAPFPERLGRGRVCEVNLGSRLRWRTRLLEEEPGR